MAREHALVAVHTEYDPEVLDALFRALDSLDAALEVLAPLTTWRPAL